MNSSKIVFETNLSLLTENCLPPTLSSFNLSSSSPPSGYHLSHLTSLSFIVTKLPNSVQQSDSFRALLEKLVSMTRRFDRGFLYLIIERGFELKLSNC